MVVVQATPAAHQLSDAARASLRPANRCARVHDAAGSVLSDGAGERLTEPLDRGTAPARSVPVGLSPRRALRRQRREAQSLLRAWYAEKIVSSTWHSMSTKPLAASARRIVSGGTQAAMVSQW